MSGPLLREADEQEATAHQSRIERIVTQTAEAHLTHTDGKQGTDDDDPERKVTWQVHTEQETSDDGRTIEQTGLLL